MNGPGTTFGSHRARLRVAIVATVVAMLAGLAPISSRATTGFTFNRIAGVDRYDTARQLALGTFSSADIAIVASGENYPDALAASYLAGQSKAPVLLTPADSVPSATLDALSKLKVKTVYLLGGPVAINPTVEAKLKATPSSNAAGGMLTVTRIGGVNRYDTARLEALQPGADKAGSVGGKKTALVASGQNYPDALAAGPLAYAGKLPLLLTDPKTLSPETKTALTTLGIQQVTLLGGTVAVSSDVDSQLTAMSISVTRVFGIDRTDTASRIADTALATLGFQDAHVNLARGDGYADALSGGPHGGVELAPTLLAASPTSLGSPTSDWLVGRSATLHDGHVFGGTAAIRDTTAQSAGALASHDGPVLLNTTSVPAGGNVVGRVASPASVTSVSVSGCGADAGAVTLDASGGFTLAIPASQPPQGCALTFTVKRNDNTTATQTFDVKILPAHQVATAAPDLVSANLNSDGTVTYTFDAPVTLPSDPSTNPATKFHVYDTSGDQITPVSVKASGSTVVATFGPNNAKSATLATVEQGAVNDGQSHNSPECGTALQTVASGSSGTSAADLIAVKNLKPSSNGVTADFVFDQPVSPPVNGGNFELIDNQASSYAGDPATQGFSSDFKTVTLNFPGAVFGTVVRGGVKSQAVFFPPNPHESANVTSDGATVAPNLVSATPHFDSMGTLTDVAYTFDAAPTSPVAMSFFVYDTNAQELTGSGTPTVSGNTVTVTFSSSNPNPTFQTVAGFAADDGAVKDSAGHTSALESVMVGSSTTQAGVTGLPDLIGASTSGGNVTFSFDKALSSTPPAGNFTVYSADATAYAAASVSKVTLDASGKNVTVSFTTNQVSGAVAAGVHDGNAPTPVPGGETRPPMASSPGIQFPEGCASLASG